MVAHPQSRGRRLPSASCKPLATSASRVPVTVSGIDQMTFRAGLSLFQMPGTQLNLSKSSSWTGQKSTPSTEDGSRFQPFFPDLQGMLAAWQSPQSTNAPASFAEFDSRREAALAEPKPLDAITVATRHTILATNREPWPRSTRDIVSLSPAS